MRHAHSEATLKLAVMGTIPDICALELDLAIELASYSCSYNYELASYELASYRCSYNSCCLRRHACISYYRPLHYKL